MQILPLKPTLAILTFVALTLAPDYIPRFKDYKVLDARTLWDSLWRFEPRRNAGSPVEEETERLRPELAVSKSKPTTILDPANSMDAFYEALLQAERRRDASVATIVHYGDSPTTADLITADARQLLQKQFGDAGHGYVLIGKPWAWYGHRGVEMNSEGWKIAAANQTDVKDGLFGLGGVSFFGHPGDSARLTLKEPHDSMEVSFLLQPSGGVVKVLANGRVIGEVDTNFPQTTSGYSSLPLPAGARRIDLQVASGSPRLFGVSFTRKQPGVVYHSLGLNGAYVSVLSRMFKENHWAENLKHFQPHLVIVNYGTNESQYADFVDKAYEKEMREVIRRIRAALPGAAILVMSPMDRGVRQAGGDIGTLPVLSRLVTIQQRLAAEQGCAFFNTFQAMGGAGTMGQWYRAEPRLVSADFIHPMPAGAKIVADLLYKGLMEGYNRYKLRQIQQRQLAAQPAPGGKTLPAPTGAQQPPNGVARP